MSDYTLLEAALELGGKVISVTLENVADGVPAVRGASAFPLSKLHKCPQVEYRQGASLLKASRGGEAYKPVGGKRKPIKGFSDSARRRMQCTMAGIRKDADLPLFITLTYPAIFPTVEEAKRDIKLIRMCISRAFPGAGFIWKLEPQERGAPHFHILLWGVEFEKLYSWMPSEWHRIAGKGDNLHLLWHEGKLGNGNKHCVQQVRSYSGVMAYASKYLSKTFEVAGWSEQWVGRFWAVVNRSNIPFGELVQQEVTRKKAVEILRYGKKFISNKQKKKKSNKKKTKYRHRNNNSLTIFCDADQWIKKIGLPES